METDFEGPAFISHKAYTYALLTYVCCGTLSKPQWVKVKNIVLKDGKYYAHPNPLPFDSATIEQLNTALQAAGYTELSVCDEHDSGMSSLRP